MERGKELLGIASGMACSGAMQAVALAKDKLAGGGAASGAGRQGAAKPKHGHSD